MRAIRLSAYGAPPSLALEELPGPLPGAGEVLVRMAAAPVNPSDLAFLAGTYGVRKRLPVVPGFEGSGVVVSTGAGAEALAGARVAVTAGSGDGTWAELVVTRARLCTPVLATTGLEAAAALTVNPLTAWALLDVASRGSHRAAIQTAAGSALGRMLLRLAKRRGVPMIHVVRGPARAEELRALGGEHVLDSSAPGFDAELARLALALGATIAFDAVAGPLTGRLVAAMPEGGRVLVYGALSSEPSSLSPLDLVFGGRRVEGFWLAGWMRERGATEVAAARAGVEAHIGGDLRTDFAERATLDRAVEAILCRSRGERRGKLLLLLGGDPA
jgi:NADPH:quinone reductase-like Zn-dependent oxidoreductase